ncbi:SGNH/GDSL hydrolase family protein [Oxalobacteraceae bacterium OM1]|nr:SGNH/GDSL hydrolase family protein [Oxalobacteraceae bacterium OM1]
MRHWLPEMVAVPLLPLLVVQGRRTRRVTPRLPEAQGPTQGCTHADADGRTLRLLTVGESPVAGVGVDTHESGITGQLARALAERSGMPVAWHAIGRNGATAREALVELVPLVPRAPVDIAMIAFGVNDTTEFRPVHRWRHDLAALIEAVTARAQPRCLILAGVPEVGRLPALPQPLRAVMGMKARALDMVTRRLAATLPGTIYVPVGMDPDRPDHIASDGYHPSAAGCAVWAQVVAQACRLSELR